MNKYFKLITKSVLAFVSLISVVSCNDAWNDHYSVNSDGDEAVASLGQTLASIPEAGKFVDALKSTYMFNGTKQLSLTYWDLLNDNQFLTVWLPDPASITDEEWDEYTSTDEDKDHKKVGTEFILNHIARFSHPVGDTKKRIKMMSNKTYESRGDNKTIDGINYKDKNIRCTNGILHSLTGRIVYRPNLYDYITGASTIKSAKGKVYNYRSRNGEIGKWLAQFTKKEIDEERSIKGDINEETGEVEYIDSVMTRSNAVLKKFGYIDVEDSSYIVVLPEERIWDSVYNAVKYYFDYDATDIKLVPVADSLQKYWTNDAMLTDIFFNKNSQKHILDSVTSTQFSKSERFREKYPYHVFQKPYAEGGLFDCVDSIKCSNGVIYIKDSWPYSDSVFRRTIKVEAEDEIFATEKIKTKRKNLRYYDKDSVIRTTRAIEFFSTETKLELNFSVKNTLRGKYRIKAVFFKVDKQATAQNVNFSVDFLWGSGSKQLWNGNQKGSSKREVTV